MRTDTDKDGDFDAKGANYHKFKKGSKRWQEAGILTMDSLQVSAFNRENPRRFGFGVGGAEGLLRK